VSKPISVVKFAETVRDLLPNGEKGDGTSPSDAGEAGEKES
jgi:hypothetical protein